ncbi:MAG: hypothetical protein ACYDCM_02670 [Candidatus Acidiferrales bacterium]
MSTPPDDVLPDERSDRSSESSDPQATANEQVVELGPWFALFRVAVGDRIPQGPLGSGNVPPSALALPIEWAIEHLVLHAKRCNNPYCPHVPAPLHLYRRMRPDAIRGQAGLRERVFKTLWNYRDHELVRWVQDRILGAYPRVADAVSLGEFTADGLHKLLSENGKNGPAVLAAVLWATGFKGKDTELLFRCLVALVELEQAQGIEKAQPTESPDDSKSFRLQFRAARRELNRAVQTSEQLQHDLQLKKSALEMVHRDLEDSEKKYKQAIDDVNRLRFQLRETDLAYKEAKRGGEKATNTANTLRRDLREQQKAIEEMEASRADLALRLAVEGQTIKRLKLELASVPRGSNAVNVFLREEEERLEIARTIASGGDRARADQAWTFHRKLKSAFLEAYPQYRQAAPIKARAKTVARLFYFAWVHLGGNPESYPEQAIEDMRDLLNKDNLTIVGVQVTANGTTSSMGDVDLSSATKVVSFTENGITIVVWKLPDTNYNPFTDPEYEFEQQMSDFTAGDRQDMEFVNPFSSTQSFINWWNFMFGCGTFVPCQ